MLELGLKILLAYLLGTALGSLILGRARGIDIRNLGSGNAGATNAMRTQGKVFAAGVLSIDIVKGLIAVLWLPAAMLPAAMLPGVRIDPGVPRGWLEAACGLAVIVGHVYPVWFGFRGGKGFATVIGVVGGLNWHLLLVLLGAWLLVLGASGYVGLATMTASVVLAAAACLFYGHNLPLVALTAAVAAFVIFTHRANIARMRAGKESRVRRAWLFRSRTA